MSGVQTPFPQRPTTLKQSDISILVTSHTHRKPPPPTATEGSKTAEGQQMRVDQQAKPSAASQVSTPHKKTGCPRLEESCQIRELTLKPARSVTFTEIRTKSKHKRNSQGHRRKESQPNSLSVKNPFSCYQGHRKTIGESSWDHGSRLPTSLSLSIQGTGPTSFFLNSFILSFF